MFVCFYLVLCQISHINQSDGGWIRELGFKVEIRFAKMAF